MVWLHVWELSILEFINYQISKTQIVILFKAKPINLGQPNKIKYSIWKRGGIDSTETRDAGISYSSANRHCCFSQAGALLSSRPLLLTWKIYLQIWKNYRTFIKYEFKTESKLSVHLCWQNGGAIDEVSLITSSLQTSSFHCELRVSSGSLITENGFPVSSFSMLSNSFLSYWMLLSWKSYYTEEIQMEFQRSWVISDST